MDTAPTAIAIARRKASQRGLSARFLVWDALRLADLGESFDTVLDCGLFHVFDDRDRREFVGALLITGQLVLHKKAMPASQYVRYAHGLKGATNVVLHARFATKGRPLDAANNHPIRSGPIVGVHNGHVVNDDELFGWVGGPRRGTVDSEAIFAVLARSGLPAKSALWRVEGRAAIAWIDRRKPGALNLARMDTSPLTVGRSDGGSIIFASTESILARACRRAGIRLEWRSQLDEGSSLSVPPGRRIDYRTIGAGATTAMGTSEEAREPSTSPRADRHTSIGAGATTALGTSEEAPRADHVAEGGWTTPPGWPPRDRARGNLDRHGVHFLTAYVAASDEHPRRVAGASLPPRVGVEWLSRAGAGHAEGHAGRTRPAQVDFRAAEVAVQRLAVTARADPLDDVGRPATERLTMARPASLLRERRPGACRSRQPWVGSMRSTVIVGGTAREWAPRK